MSDHISAALAHIFKGIELLQKAHPARRFTIDGRLVGDIGEVIAAAEYDIELDEVSQAKHDPRTSDGRKVQIKVGFRDELTFVTEPEYYLGLKLNRDGSYEEIFNGPGKYISDYYRPRRKHFGSKLMSLPNERLKSLSQRIPEAERIPKRLVKRG